MSNDQQVNPQPDPIIANLSKVLTDLGVEQKRIKDSEVSLEMLQAEYHGTILPFMKDIVQVIIQQAYILKNAQAYIEGFQDWAMGVSEHLEANDSRLELVEDFSGSGTVVMPEDYELFSRVATACKTLAEVFLNGPFPIQGPDEEGKKKLFEVLQMVQQMEVRLSDSLVEEEEDNEEGDEGDEGPEQPAIN